MIKYRQAIEAALEIFERPLAAAPTGKLFDAFAGSWVVERLYERMVADLPPERAEHLRALTRTEADAAALLALPEHTFGHQFSAYMQRRAFALDGEHTEFVPVNEAFERNWIMHRFAKVHDFAHVLLDIDIDPPGETAMQLFHLVNFGEPWGVAAVASLPLIVARHGQPREMLAAMGRAARIAREADNVFLAPLEEWLEDDLAAVRRRLGIVL